MATFTIYAYPRQDDQPTRIGIVAGRRFETHVRRNRAKRRLRAACQALLPQLPPGYDLVLVAQLPALDAPFEQLQRELVGALSELGILLSEGGGSS